MRFFDMKSFFFHIVIMFHFKVMQFHPLTLHSCRRGMIQLFDIIDDGMKEGTN